jgi:hypothetical protein
MALSLGRAHLNWQQRSKGPHDMTRIWDRCSRCPSSTPQCLVPPLNSFFSIRTQGQCLEWLSAPNGHVRTQGG